MVNITCSTHKVVKNKVKLTNFIVKPNAKKTSRKLQNSETFMKLWRYRYELIFIVGCFITSMRILHNPTLFSIFRNPSFPQNLTDNIFKDPFLFGSAFLVISVLKTLGIAFRKSSIRQIANILSISVWSMWGATFFLATPANTVSALSAIMVMFSLVFLVQEGSDKI